MAGQPIDLKNLNILNVKNYEDYHRKKRFQRIAICMNMLQYTDKDVMLMLAAMVDDLSGEDRDRLLTMVRDFNEDESGEFSDLHYHQLIKNALLSQVEKPVEHLSVTIPVLTDEYTKELLDDLTDVYPTDRVCLTEDVLSELKQFWHGKDSTEMDYFMPSDIFFAQQVSILDMEIFLTKVVDDVPVTYESRVCIYEDYSEILQQVSDGDLKTAPMGYLDIRIPSMNDAGLVLQFGVLDGLDVVLLDDRCALYGFLSEDVKADFVENMLLEDLVTLCTKHLQTWYTIQMTLLHPVVCELMQHGRTTKDKRRRLLGKKVLHLNRKLKVSDITMDMVQDIRQKNPVIRKTMAWYVMGHWRNYKSGKMTFIAPYWKGPLKDMKKGETRVRVIDENDVELLRKENDNGKEKEVNKETDN